VGKCLKAYAGSKYSQVITAQYSNLTQLDLTKNHGNGIGGLEIPGSSINYKVCANSKSQMQNEIGMTFWGCIRPNFDKKLLVCCVSPIAKQYTVWY